MVTFARCKIDKDFEHLKQSSRALKGIHMSPCDRPRTIFYYCFILTTRLSRTVCEILSHFPRV